MPSVNNQPLALRIVGAALSAVILGSGSVIAAVGPPSSTMFNATAPLQRLTAIADNKRGWNLFAVLCGLSSTAITVAFAVISSVLRGPARTVALVATLFSAISTLLWLPIMVRRLRVSAHVDEVIRNYRPGPQPGLSVGAESTFWPYTHTGLVSLGGMGLALAWSGVRRKTGAVACGLVVLSEAVLIPRWLDWLPALTYIFAEIIGIGLLLEKERSTINWDRA